MSFLGRVGQRFADSHFIAPRYGIDKCLVSTYEEVCYELFVVKRALEERHIVKRFKLLTNRRCPLVDMSSDLVSTRLLVSLCLILGMSKDDGGIHLPYC